MFITNLWVTLRKPRNDLDNEIFELNCGIVEWIGCGVNILILFKKHKNVVDETKTQGVRVLSTVIEPVPLQWKHGILTTGPPGNCLQ